MNSLAVLSGRSKKIEGQQEKQERKRGSFVAKRGKGTLRAGKREQNSRSSRDLKTVSGAGKSFENTGKSRRIGVMKRAGDWPTRGVWRSYLLARERGGNKQNREAWQELVGGGQQAFLSYVGKSSEAGGKELSAVGRSKGGKWNKRRPRRKRRTLPDGGICSTLTRSPTSAIVAQTQSSYGPGGERKRIQI